MPRRTTPNGSDAMRKLQLRTEALNLHVVGRLSQTAIAERLAVPLATVNSWITASRKEMAEKYTEERDNWVRDSLSRREDLWRQAQAISRDKDAKRVEKVAALKLAEQIEDSVCKLLGVYAPNRVEIRNTPLNPSELEKFRAAILPDEIEKVRAGDQETIQAILARAGVGV